MTRAFFSRHIRTVSIIRNSLCVAGFVSMLALSGCCLAWVPANTTAQYKLNDSRTEFLAHNDTSSIADAGSTADSIRLEAFLGHDTIAITLRGNWRSVGVMAPRDYLFTYITERYDSLAGGSQWIRYEARENSGNGTLSVEYYHEQFQLNTTFDLTFVDVADSTRTIRITGQCNTYAGTCEAL